MEFPDLTGQPPWVVIIVVAMVVAGGVGIAALSRRAGAEEEEPEQLAPADEADQQALPSGTTDPAIQVLERALQELAEVARREAAESAEARKDVEVLRTRLDQCAQDVHAARQDVHTADANRREAERQLTECRSHANLLAEQVRALKSQNGATG